MTLADDLAAGIRIDAGTTIICFSYDVQRDERHWDRPNDFDPGRFIHQTREVQRPFTHLPFGAGPRTSVGASFAMLQTTSILVELLRRFDISPFGIEPTAMRAEIILKPREAIRMTAAPRARVSA